MVGYEAVLVWERVTQSKGASPGLKSATLFVLQGKDHRICLSIDDKNEEDRQMVIGKYDADSPTEMPSIQY
ncbi:hypothetical protein K443DRAFT_682286 [Laccaria amethystina LaAM-08-1]|uniref:Unplaced genomic scaffold K443scaffold_184, whole genome shotgun sequence n=1 Tax=Laccaria amethystina LaAM-08-1 TaxID=1095629 RepID=A0A0C9XFU1_9AGAR|nr:hypothetical protein K443DRAFT_682286 [Laccaria amethystina LaAM-08-1]